MMGNAFVRPLGGFKVRRQSGNTGEEVHLISRPLCRGDCVIYPGEPKYVLIVAEGPYADWWGMLPVYRAETVHPLILLAECAE